MFAASMTAVASDPSDEPTIDDPSNASNDKNYYYSNYFDEEGKQWNSDINFLIPESTSKHTNPM